MSDHAVACPDKFRGTLTAVEAAAAMAAGLRSAGYESVLEIPMADGGEVTLEALLAGRGGIATHRDGDRTAGERVQAEWAVRSDGTGVIEMARERVALLGAERDPLRVSSRGTGELIAAAACVVSLGSSSASAGARAPTADWPRSRRSGGRSRGST